MIEIKTYCRGTTFKLDQETEQELFKFFTKLRVEGDVIHSSCSKCGEQLHTSYSFIIYNLRKAGLLIKEENMLCCGCMNMKNSPKVENALRELREFIETIKLTKLIN